MCHARERLNRTLHVQTIVRRGPQTRKSLKQTIIREIRVRVGGYCQETVMTVLQRAVRSTCGALFRAL